MKKEGTYDYIMKKIVYVSNVPEDITPGYKEKIRAQALSLSKTGMQSYLLTMTTNGVVLYLIIDGKFKVVRTYHFEKFNSRFVNKIYLKIFRIRRKIFNTAIRELMKTENPSVIYFRRILPLDFGVIRTLSKLYKNNIRIIYEYPTYPWKEEMKKSGWISFFIELNLDKLIQKYVEIFVVILGKKIELTPKFIEISNGIDLKSIVIRKYVEREKDEREINLLAVAHIMEWHGFDRLIEGLNQYMRKTPNPLNIKLHIVGEGLVKASLMSLVSKYKLEKNIFFHGKLVGEELEKLYSDSDIGIGSLGMHRIGLDYGSTLKLREYCAKGIPFIYAYHDKDFDGKEFCLKFSNDNTFIQIEEIIAFSEKLNYCELVTNMRIFAEKTLSWETKMEPVILEIKKMYELL